MFETIMLPVDLQHEPAQARALDAAAGLARQHGARVVCVGVTGNRSGAAAPNPAAFAAALRRYAEEAGARHGIETEARAYVSHDPAADLDARLLRAVVETGADLIVMASHRPEAVDRHWPSHGGAIAARAPVSVMVVR